MKTFLSLLSGGVFLLVLFFPGSVLAGNSLVINELAAYEKSECEWVELYNNGGEINLENWKFWEGNTNHSLRIFSSSSPNNDWLISPGEYVIIASDAEKLFTSCEYILPNVTILDSSWTVLNESGEEIGLKDSQGNLVEIFTYLASTNASLERVNPGLDDYTFNNWVERTSGNSFALANNSVIFQPVNILPTALITGSSTAQVGVSFNLSGNLSSDQDGSISFFEWKHGGEIIGTESNLNYVLNTTGTFEISLTVTDNLSSTSTAYFSLQVLESTSTVNQVAEQPLFNCCVVISEFVANPIEGEKEWVELYNLATSTVTLEDWSLEDNTGKIYSVSTTIPAKGFFVIELASSKLNNDGDLIKFIYNGKVVDEVGYGILSLPGKNYPAPEKGQSLAKNEVGNDFVLTTTATKGGLNLITEPPKVISAPSAGGGGGGNYVFFLSSGDILINEIFPDPNSGEEFVELYNKTERDISLDGWRLEDGGGSKTNLNGLILSKKYFLITKPAGSLNNEGDLVRLIDRNETEIDKIVYGNWNDGKLSDNANKPKEGESLNRQNFLDTNVDEKDFALSGSVTPGKENIITWGEGKISKNLTLIINEVLPNPIGSDEKDEFVEIFNSTSSTINIAQWKITNGSGAVYVLPDKDLGGGEFLVIYRKESGLILKNNSDEIKLFTPDGLLVQEVRYTSRAEEGLSWSNCNNLYYWSLVPTPGRVNIVKKINLPPSLELEVQKEGKVYENILMDASDTTDSNNENLRYWWDFGDGIYSSGITTTHAYSSPGDYKITLRVSDGSETSTKKQNLKIFSGDIFSEQLPVNFQDKISLSELMPNPEEGEEYIEIENLTRETLDLSGVTISDKNAGKPFQIKNIILAANSWVVFYKKDTHLSLNNEGDEVVLQDREGKVISKVSYGKSISGWSYSKINNKWIWTKQITPGAANPIGQAPTLGKVAGIKISNFAYQNANWDKISELNSGDFVRLSGLVVVIPGVFGSQYFYIMDPDSSSGIQIYSYKKVFPNLNLGDRIEVQGEIGVINGEKRLKTKSLNDFKIISEGEVSPVLMEMAEIGREFNGALLQVEGEVTDLKANYFYLDDGTEEIKVNLLKSWQSKFNRTKGEVLRVVGVLRVVNGENTLFPRSLSDIEKIGQVSGIVKKNEPTSNYLNIGLVAFGSGLSAVVFANRARLLSKILFFWKFIKDKIS